MSIYLHIQGEAKTYFLTV